ncbi:MAG: ABC transporter permease subunit [Phycisphaeraceae bacterium]|nr:ABC transporter permease subunit [Phycisphaeraceae bacterium]MCP4068003.1 ABC transporter permease subunit [Phycisphaeraceae bacterium]MCP4495781.1 ABC transporter permease subunit [Phycisphaeraceae bacterium]MCP4796802.1 ABC transporter permease subunit [Phycisphaeraceae bacterium]MCP4938656.1 ABC transporter permease subunit [Phycisphaeraceae bacterium]
MTSIATHIVAPPRRRFLQVRTIWLLVRKELRDSLRNRWFLLYTMAFTALAFGLAYLSQIGTGYGGLAGFGKTAASLVNLTLLIVPLMAVTMGALSLSSERERGMLAYMLAQPVTRTEVFLSKFIGQGIAFAGTIAIGFGSSAALLSRQGAADGEIFLRLAGLSLLLALAMLATGMLIATVVRRASAAMGTAVFVWLFVTLFGDLGVMGASSVLRLEVDQMLALTLANPTQLFKLASIAGFDATLDLLGPAGLYAVRTYGDWLTTFLVSLLVVWVLVPLGIGSFIFSRRPL